MQQVPIPDTDLIDKIGVVSWLLVLVVSFGVVTVGWFLHRLVRSIDAMAKTHEVVPVLLAEMKSLLGKADAKLDETLEISRENLRIARLWETTEAVGRTVREDKR